MLYDIEVNSDIIRFLINIVRKDFVVDFFYLVFFKLYFMEGVF